MRRRARHDKTRPAPSRVARFSEGAEEVLGRGGVRARARAAPCPCPCGSCGTCRRSTPPARGSTRQLEEDELGRGSAVSVAGACCWNTTLSAAAAGPAEKIELKGSSPPSSSAGHKDD